MHQVMQNTFVENSYEPYLLKKLFYSLFNHKFQKIGKRWERKKCLDKTELKDFSCRILQLFRNSLFLTGKQPNKIGNLMASFRTMWNSLFKLFQGKDTEKDMVEKEMKKYLYKHDIFYWLESASQDLAALTDMHEKSVDD